MKPVYYRYIAAGVIGIIALIAFFIMKGVIPGLKNAPASVTLTIWGFPPESYFTESFAGYHAKNPGVRITYTQFDETTYEEEIMSGLATGKGSNILMVQNTWLARPSNKLILLDAPSESRETLLEQFPEVVRHDFVKDDALFGLPLSIDTLALLYNKRLFEDAAIVFPPTTWNEFKFAASTLTRRDETGAFLQYGAAIGGNKASITNTVDILTAFFLQLKVVEPTKMIAEEARDAFVRDGEQALLRYTQFASPAGGGTYIWDSPPRTTDFITFAQGKTAMIFGYAKDLAALTKWGSELRVGAAPFPRIEAFGSQLTIARYFGFAVPHTSGNPEAAWDFIQSMTTDPALISHYLVASDEPPALKTLIDQYIKTRERAPFVEQTLTARSWNAYIHKTTNSVFDTMITDALREMPNMRPAILKALSVFFSL